MPSYIDVISDLEGQRVITAKLIGEKRLEIKISNGDVVTFDAYSIKEYGGESLISHEDTKKNSREKRSYSLIRVILPGDIELFIDVTNQVSNEKPKELCTNRMISFKVGEKIFHYFDLEPKVALSKFKSQLSARMQLEPFKLPELVFCVITHFNTDFNIEWDNIEMHYHYSSGALLTN